MNQRKPKTNGRGGRSRRPSKNSKSSAQPLEPSTTTTAEIESFDHWALGEPVQASIRDMGITKPTPIQALAIGPVLEGRDVIAKAETGTGKTLAFGAPMMARIDPSRASVLGLVLCPTRELSEQVYKVLAELGRVRAVRVALIVGGEDMRPQVDALKGGAQLVVGTPGRVLDLMRQGFLSFPWTEYVVLDEADKMLEIGFLPDVEKILAATPEERQTLLFSATFPNELLTLARRSTRDPVEIATASGIATVDTIAQYYIEVGDEDRVRTLARLIENSAPEDVFLVFCDRRTDVDRLMRRMETMRFSVKSLHGGYDQAARFRVMTAFRTGEVKALLATDVASRGLDVDHVTHVVNFGAPRDASDYTHRIGRTGRAGRSGTAVTLVPPAARGRWRAILHALPWDIEELEDVRNLSAGKTGKSASSRARTAAPPPSAREEVAPAQSEPSREALAPAREPDERGPRPEPSERGRTERGRSQRGRGEGARRESGRSEGGRSESGRGERTRGEGGRSDSERSGGGTKPAPRPAEGERRSGRGERHGASKSPEAPAKDSFGDGVEKAAERPARGRSRRKSEAEHAKPERAHEPERRGRLDFGSGV